MADIDSFSLELLEEAKRFFEMANETNSADGKRAFFHASLFLALSALEGHINSVATDFEGRNEISIHERGLLLERDVKLDKGQFVFGNLKISRLEDRIQLLIAKFTNEPFDSSQVWWAKLKGAIIARNKLVHPKDVHAVTEADVQSALEAVIEGIDAVYKAVYRRSFPALKRNLHSKLVF